MAAIIELNTYLNGEADLRDQALQKSPRTIFTDGNDAEIACDAYVYGGPQQDKQHAHYQPGQLDQSHWVRYDNVEEVMP